MLTDFFFPRKNTQGLSPYKGVLLVQVAKEQRHSFLFLSFVKVTSSFLLSTQSLCSGIIFTAAFPADSIFRLPCACHTPAPFPLALINLLSTWKGNERTGFCDVVCLTYHGKTN